MLRTLIAKLFLSVPNYFLFILALLAVAAFRRGANPRLRRWRYLFVVGFVVTYLIGAPAFTNEIVYRIEHRYEPRPIVEADRNPDNLILVPTGGWFRWDGNRVDLKISEDGWERLDGAIKLWQKIGGTILIAGAPSPDGSGNSIAAVMADAARDRGVPSGALMVEPLSRDTHQNITFSLPTLEAHGDHLWLVTSAVHLPRAMAVAKKAGLRPIPYPWFYKGSTRSDLDEWIPDNDGPAAFATAMHEVLGFMFYRLRGWV